MKSRIMRTAVASAVLIAGLCMMAWAEERGREAVREAEMPVVKLALSMVNAKEHGAVGDGEADDTQALQNALNAAVEKGPICYLPAGHYRINGSLVVPPGVTLCGASGGVPHSEHPIGTVLLAYGGKGKADGEPLVTLKPNAVIRNLVIHYPEQTLPDVVAYPWTIRGDGEMCQVLDITITNPYQALDFGTKWNELHLIRNVFACPLRTGLFIDQCTDIGRVENVHFNPNFWTRMALEPKYPGGDIKAYLEKNLVGFKVGKTDWEYMTNCFVIFPKVGFHFDDFGHGPGNAVITQSGSDICPVSVQVDRVQNHAGVQFVNGQFMAIQLTQTNGLERLTEEPEFRRWSDLEGGFSVLRSYSAVGAFSSFMLLSVWKHYVKNLSVVSAMTP